jgi:S-DNA-T family DNA segregation ATPase FtsK/SpoIIIE
MVPGRALCPRDRAELQIVAPPSDLAMAIAEIAQAVGPARRRPPRTVDPLPRRVAVADLVPRARRHPDGWVLPVGLDRRQGTVAAAVLGRGGTFVVLGPPGSGRTTMLRTLAAGLAYAEPGVARYGVGPRGQPLGALGREPRGPGDVARWVEELAADDRARVIFVDDCDQLGGPSFERLATLVDERTTFVLASTPEATRSLGHWSRPLVRTRRGLLLSPVAGDGDLLRVTVPARVERSERGFGLLVADGTVVPLLCAGGEEERDDRAA